MSPVRLVILMNPRSGSTSLGRTLSTRDDFHCWDEIFNGGGWSKADFTALKVRRWWKFEGTMREYLDHLAEETLKKTGKENLGVQVKPFDQVLNHKVLGADPWERWLNYVQVLEWATHVVILYRESLFEQALSLHIAWHKGGWGKAQPFQPFRADCDRFHATMRRLWAAECFMRSTFWLAGGARRRDTPYEEISRVGLGPVEGFLGLPGRGEVPLGGWGKINTPQRLEKVINLAQLQEVAEEANLRARRLPLSESFQLLSQ